MDRLEVIRSLELELTSVETRKNSSRLDQLLTEDFAEVGTSGKRYLKSDVVEALVSSTHADYELSNFSFAELSRECVLATYVATVGGHQSYRCSVWVHANNGWKMRYHQSTPIGDKSGQ